MASTSILVSAPPKDTPFIVAGRITDVWLSWLGSITTTSNVIGNLQSLINALGSAAFQQTSAFDAAGTAAAAQAAAIAASLQKSASLGDVSNVASARTNLGLGSAATQPATAFDAAGAAATVQAASLQKSANLSDLANAGTARTNLGLGTAATQNSSAFGSVSAANTWAGAQTFSAAVTFSAPASMVFGSGWQSWTPTVGGGGSMTVSGLTVGSAQFLTIGEIVHFSLFVSFTLGGTLSNFVVISAPAANAGPITHMSTSIAPGGVVFSPAFGYLQASNTNLIVQPSGGANFSAGAYGVYMSGFYRSA